MLWYLVAWGETLGKSARRSGSITDVLSYNCYVNS